jgi:hypothetical protein
MSPKPPMSLICIYLFVKTIVFRNEHIQLVFMLNTTCIKIRAQGSENTKKKTLGKLTVVEGEEERAA